MEGLIPAGSTVLIGNSLGVTVHQRGLRTPGRLPSTAKPLQTVAAGQSSQPLPATAHASATLATCGALLAWWGRRNRRGGRNLRQGRAALEDGTNAEDEDLAQPLPFSSVTELDRVLLYQQELSPPCAKIRTLLDYYRVPYRTIKGKHPTSEYKRIPVLVIKGKARTLYQINDSHIIVKNIAPLLTGEELSPDEVAWERKITFGFQPAIEVELLSNEFDAAKIFARTFDYMAGWQRVLIGALAPVLGGVVGALFKSKYPEYQGPSWSVGKEFRSELGSRPFFHGDQPGPVDLSFYGTYSPFLDCRSTLQFLQNSDLEAWNSRMVEAMP